VTVTREDYAAGLMGEAVDASTGKVAALRRFVERIDPAKATAMVLSRCWWPAQRRLRGD
jgi:hypothetical protein